MAGRSRPTDGVASLAYVPAIHALLSSLEDVDARHKAGHDESKCHAPGAAAFTALAIACPAHTPMRHSTTEATM